jgi:hypothetical protein
MNTEERDRMRILVAAASRHGSTTEIAIELGKALRRALPDAAVEVVPLTWKVGFDGYDAVVLGSAVYFGRWLDEAHGVIDAKIAVGLVRTRDGDCRDWPAVRAWADHIAVDLTLTGRSAIVRGDQR